MVASATQMMSGRMMRCYTGLVVGMINSSSATHVKHAYTMQLIFKQDFVGSVLQTTPSSAVEAAIA